MSVRGEPTVFFLFLLFAQFEMKPLHFSLAPSRTVMPEITHKVMQRFVITTFLYSCLKSQNIQKKISKQRPTHSLLKVTACDSWQFAVTPSCHCFQLCLDTHDGYSVIKCLVVEESVALPYGDFLNISLYLRNVQVHCSFFFLGLVVGSFIHNSSFTHIIQETMCW